MSNETGSTKIFPLMPLRDIVIFPYMVAPLVVGRKHSIEALEDAMEKRTEIFLVTQKESSEDEPGPDDIYNIGTLATVMQLLRLPDGTIKALVEGKQRAEIVSFVPHEKFIQVELRELHEDLVISSEVVAYERELRKCFEEYAASNKKIAKEVVKSVDSIDDQRKLVDVISAHLPLKADEKQVILECKTLNERIERILEIMNREIELAELENAVKKKKLPALAREKITKEFKKLKNMPPMSAETTVVRNYIDCILSLPWKKKSKSVIDINKAEMILDEDHYGLKKPKERIIEYLAVQAQVKKIKGPILCLVGPPGVGKTSICRSVARALNRKFVRLSLGGVRDEAEIRGHRRTYIGAMPGKIIQSMQRAGVSNPVFCLDEVDKMSMDFRGDPSSALLEVLDPEQNIAFNDHYLDIDYDLSEVFFITTANNLHGIPVPLQDRMEIIQISGYTEEEKLRIADGYLIPKQLQENGFKDRDISLTDGAVLEIIRRYTKEAGVRDLERNVSSICRKIARDRLKKGLKDKKYRLSLQAVTKYLGTPKYRYGLAEEHDRVGLATGLAWTEVGGELLQIEATLMPGSGKLIITGKLGDVMQESAQAALSYVRSRAERLGLESDFYQKLDIHVHVPEGAIPKDGPSAGITIATSIVSALVRKPVRHQLAMTGEITLRGRVLPIGGLTEKLLAAKRGNITNVLVPRDNERNLNDVPLKILKELSITLVEHMDEVLEHSVITETGETLFKDAPINSVYNEITVSEHNTTQ